MYIRLPILCALATCLGGCHTYTPMPIDLDRHLEAMRLRTPPAEMSATLPREHARELAKLFHPDARLARRRAGIQAARKEHAGAWDDPQLQTQLQRILQSVPHQWVTQVQVGFTLPINGRLDKERELAGRQNDEALFAAWATEQQVANGVDRAWVAWSTATLRVQELDRTCDNLQQLAELANALTETGGLSVPAARVFTLEHQQQRVRRENARAEAAAARLEVLRRVGLPPDAVVALQPDVAVAPFEATTDARRSSLAESPRLNAQRLEHRTAEANLQLQIRKQWPDLQLGPLWQDEEGQSRPGLILNLPLPVFTGNDPAIAEARAERELTAEALRATFEQLLQELAIAEIRYAAAVQPASQFRELVTTAEQQIEDARSLAQAGQLDAMLMLDALLRAHDVRMQAIAAEQDASIATITINDLLTDPNSRIPALDSGDNR